MNLETSDDVKLLSNVSQIRKGRKGKSFNRLKIWFHLQLLHARIAHVTIALDRYHRSLCAITIRFMTAQAKCSVGEFGY